MQKKDGFRLIEAKAGFIQHCLLAGYSAHFPINSSLSYAKVQGGQGVHHPYLA